MRRALLGLTVVVALAMGSAGMAKAHGKSVIAALDLPVQAHKLRQAGVDGVELSGALAAARAKGLSAAESRDLLLAANRAIAAKGKIESFQTFIEDQLASGKRGKALRKRGKGKKGKGRKGKGKKGGRR